MSELAQFPTPTTAILIFLMPDLIKLTNYSHFLAWSKIQVQRRPFGFIISIRSGCDCYDRQNSSRGRFQEPYKDKGHRPFLLQKEGGPGEGGAVAQLTEHSPSVTKLPKPPPAVGRAHLRR